MNIDQEIFYTSKAAKEWIQSKYDYGEELPKDTYFFQAFDSEGMACWIAVAIYEE